VTTPSTPRTRWSKGAIRSLAWVTGGLTFIVSGAVVASAPRPAGQDAGARRAEAPQHRIVRRIERRIVVDPPTVIVSGGSGSGGASYVPDPGASGGSTTSTTTGGTGGTGGSTTTGGS